MQIDHRVFELDVPEQQLNRPQVGTRLQEMGGVRCRRRCAETRFSIWARVAAD